MTLSRPAIWLALVAVFGIAAAGPVSAQQGEPQAKPDLNPHPEAEHLSEMHGDAPHSTDGHAAGEHAATVRGKPHGKFGKIPEFLYVDPILFGWTLAVFVVLAFLLRQLAWKPILAALHEREQTIERSRAEAARAREEAKLLLAQHDEEMGRAHEEAKRLLEQAREEATRECEELLSKAKQEAAEAHEQAEAAIAQAKEQALQEVRESAVELGSRIAGKVVDKQFQGDFRHLAEETTA